MVRILRFQCRGHGFNPWLGNEDPHKPQFGKKKKEKTLPLPVPCKNNLNFASTSKIRK